MYTNKNLIKTVTTARQLLKDGFVKGKWICHNEQCNKVECCAEGAVMLAVGLNEDVGSSPTPYLFKTKTEKKKARYAEHIISLLNERLDRDYIAGKSDYDTIVDLNDDADSTYGDVSKYFNLILKDLKKNA